MNAEHLYKCWRKLRALHRRGVNVSTFTPPIHHCFNYPPFPTGTTHFLPTSPPPNIFLLSHHTLLVQRVQLRRKAQTLWTVCDSLRLTLPGSADTAGSFSGGNRSNNAFKIADTTYRTDSTDVGIVNVQVHLFPFERLRSRNKILVCSLAS